MQTLHERPVLDIVINMRGMMLKNRRFGDGIIAAQAKMKNWPLITNDKELKRIAEFFGVRVR